MTIKRMTSILPVLSLFLLMDLATDAQAATYRVKSFDVPGATSTYAQSINDRGQVAGHYLDASNISHGFVYSEGKFTLLDPPGATSTYAQSINDRGQVAGYYSDASGTHGFVYSGGQVTSFDIPGARSISAKSINASGQVAGEYVDASADSTRAHDISWLVYNHGFVYSGGQVTSFDPPMSQWIIVESINAHGQVAGTYEDNGYVGAGTFHGFVYSEGQVTPFNVPGAWTFVLRINDCGQVAGYYSDASGSFVYSGGQVTPFNVPGASGTDAQSINDRGQVAGEYSDLSGARHGFVYSEGQATSFDIPGATWFHDLSINARGHVAGTYADVSGSNHGFIATPMTPFSTFHVSRLVIDQNRGSLFLGSTFTLSKDSNGINPVREEVTLKIANATLTIPAGGFYHQSLFDFAGQIDNIWIWALIKTLGSNRFAFQALAYGVPLGDTKNPITVELTIGDDYGTTTANASTH